MPTYQDHIFTAMMAPDRLLDIARYFVLFDANVKKVCRYQQFYAVRNIVDTVTKFDKDGNISPVIAAQSITPAAKDNTTSENL